jgi:hypothetical protein
MGTLEDVEVVSKFVPQPSIITARNRSKKPGIHDWWAYSTPNARLDKRYLVTVRLNELVVTGESSGNAFWDFNPTTLVINNAIHVCVAGGRLRLTRPDGKEYSTKIVRTVRDSQSSPVRTEQ